MDTDIEGQMQHSFEDRDPPAIQPSSQTATNFPAHDAFKLCPQDDKNSKLTKTRYLPG